MSNIHPYQEQISRMWEFVRLKIIAQRSGHWIEAISLAYILMEIELRILLTSKAGKDAKPLPLEQINSARYLMDLANLARENEFIDDELFEKIKTFNKIRGECIHQLAQGAITYSQLEATANNTTEIIGEIQSKFLPIYFGEVETYEEYIKRQEQEGKSESN